jgi:hypothetical protein
VDMNTHSIKFIDFGLAVHGGIAKGQHWRGRTAT